MHAGCSDGEVLAKPTTFKETRYRKTDIETVKGNKIKKVRPSGSNRETQTERPRKDGSDSQT